MAQTNKKKSDFKTEAENKEMAEIFQSAEAVKGKRLLFDDLTKNLKSEDEVKDLIFGNELLDNPQGKHTIYYHGIEKMLRLITKSEKKEANISFDILREEKNIFLARGKQKDHNGIRHFDVRQAYEADMDSAYNIIMKAITGGKSAFELYLEFRDSNINSGYYNYLLEINTPNISHDPRLLDIYRELKNRQRDKEVEALLSKKEKPPDQTSGDY